QRREHRLLVGRESSLPKSSPILQKSVRFLEDRKLRLRFLVAGSSRTACLVQALFQRGEISDRELEFDYLAVAHGIDRPHDVRDVGVLEAAHDMYDRVSLTDVGEELVTKSLAFSRSLDETRDVDELHDRRHRLLWLNYSRELAEPRVRHLALADVRLDGAKGIVGRFRFGGSQRIEQCRFADVGEADDTQF